MNRAASLVGTIVFAFVVPAAVGGWIPWFLPHQAASPTPHWSWLGLVLVAKGLALFVWCAAGFVRNLGIPLPGAEPAHLVVKGPYRFVRNPMYVAVLTAIAGWAVFLRSPWIVAYGFAVWLVMTTFVCAYEEPKLRRLFGAEYEAYVAKVPRWLPRTKPA